MSTARNEQLWIGLGRADITACVEGMSMFGWGATDNVARGVAMPLHARAVAIAEQRGDAPLVIVSVELLIVSEALRSASLERLRSAGVAIDEHRFAMVATHTHSGPAGYSSYLWYALAGPGFSPTLLARLADGVVLAVRQAIASLEPGRIRMAAGDVGLSEPVSINRSVKAYNRNPEVVPVSVERADEAVSRRMTVLRFERENGQARGVFAVFPVHGTSVHADNKLLHPDNMGVAAQALEERAAREGERDFVALFAQESAGDVSPNYRYCKQRGLMVGRYDDDFESAAWNGGIMARAADQLLDLASSAPALEARLSGALRYRAVDEHAADADLLPRGMAGRAGAAQLGFEFALGTAEGPGPFGELPPLAVRALKRAIAGLNVDPDPRQDPKLGMFRLGSAVADRVAGRVAWPLLARLLKGDRRMRYYLSALGSQPNAELPWVPHVLPFQVLRIGDFTAGLVPFEPTTVAGKRLRRCLADTLQPAGGAPVLIGYANAYASYLCTPEEYDEQAYEGASTLFGRASLPVVATLLRGVARELTHHVESSLGHTRDAQPQERRLPNVDGFFERERAGLARLSVSNFERGHWRPAPRSELPMMGGRR